MPRLIDALKQYLANTIVYKSVSHGFHWNVEGPLFTQYHAFFEKIYEDVDDTIDTIGEWLRKFDVVAPYTLAEFVALNNMPDMKTDSNSPITMTRILLDANEKLIGDIRNMLTMADEQNEQGLLNFLADRQERHEFYGWWLRASLKAVMN